MKVYKPVPNKGVTWGIGLMIGTGLIVLIPILFIVFSEQILWPILLVLGITFCGLVAMFAYLTWAAKTMEYVIGDKEVLVKWASSVKKIPFESIEHVSLTMGSSVMKVVGASWPGFHMGSFTSPTGKGTINLYATRVLGDIIIIKTKWETIGITPEDSDGFMRELNQQIPNLDKRETSLTPGNAYQAWKDKKFLLMTGIALLVLIGTGIYLSQVIPTLPPEVPMHYNYKGQVDRYGSPTEIYMPFGIGVGVVLLMLGINTATGRNNKASSFMIGITTVFISILFSLIAIAMTMTAG